ncbi:hypothetical protein OAO01_06945 [Oligoflexia bacterium]|nr:hypothetical protein [Oligoflexia bacterium]
MAKVLKIVEVSVVFSICFIVVPFFSTEVQAQSETLRSLIRALAPVTLDTAFQDDDQDGLFQYAGSAEWQDPYRQGYNAMISLAANDPGRIDELYIPGLESLVLTGADFVALNRHCYESPYSLYDSSRINQHAASGATSIAFQNFGFAQKENSPNVFEYLKYPHLSEFLNRQALVGGIKRVTLQVGAVTNPLFFNTDPYYAKQHPLRRPNSVADPFNGIFKDQSHSANAYVYVREPDPGPSQGSQAGFGKRYVTHLVDLVEPEVHALLTASIADVVGEVAHLKDQVRTIVSGEYMLFTDSARIGTDCSIVTAKNCSECMPTAGYSPARDRAFAAYQRLQNKTPISLESATCRNPETVQLMRDFFQWLGKQLDLSAYLAAARTAEGEYAIGSFGGEQEFASLNAGQAALEWYSGYHPEAKVLEGTYNTGLELTRGEFSITSPATDERLGDCRDWQSFPFWDFVPKSFQPRCISEDHFKQLFFDILGANHQLGYAFGAPGAYSLWGSRYSDSMPAYFTWLKNHQSEWRFMSPMRPAVLVRLDEDISWRNSSASMYSKTLISNLKQRNTPYRVFAMERSLGLQSAKSFAYSGASLVAACLKELDRGTLDTYTELSERGMHVMAVADLAQITTALTEPPEALMFHDGVTFMRISANNGTFHLIGVENCKTASTAQRELINSIIDLGVRNLSRAQGSSLAVNTLYGKVKVKYATDGLNILAFINNPYDNTAGVNLNVDASLSRRFAGLGITYELSPSAPVFRINARQMRIFRLRPVITALNSVSHTELIAFLVGAYGRIETLRNAGFRTDYAEKLIAYALQSVNLQDKTRLLAALLKLERMFFVKLRRNGSHVVVYSVNHRYEPVAGVSVRYAYPVLAHAQGMERVSTNSYGLAEMNLERVSRDFWNFQIGEMVTHWANPETDAVVFDLLSKSNSAVTIKQERLLAPAT